MDTWSQYDQTELYKVIAIITDSFTFLKLYGKGLGVGDPSPEDLFFPQNINTSRKMSLPSLYQGTLYICNNFIVQKRKFESNTNVWRCRYYCSRPSSLFYFVIWRSVLINIASIFPLVECKGSSLLHYNSSLLKEKENWYIEDSFSSFHDFLCCECTQCQTTENDLIR